MTPLKKSKAFHWEVLNDYEALKNEQDSYKQIPVVRKPDNAMVQKNYLQIKQDMQDIINSKMQRVLGDRVLEHLVVRKA
jgi:metal-responsive CopG/Arc/MetJ family transcriptional regulator